MQARQADGGDPPPLRLGHELDVQLRASPRAVDAMSRQGLSIQRTVRQMNALETRREVLAKPAGGPQLESVESTVDEPSRQYHYFPKLLEPA